MLSETKLILSADPQALSKVWNNPNIRAEMSYLAKKAGLQSEVLVCPVVTCLNTMCAVLEHMLDMQDMVTEVCDQVQFNWQDSVCLHHFILTEEEWTMLDDLYRLLDVGIILCKSL